ncbi:MAG: 3-isopropylmalate dehydratase small subunit [Firmicutes bacterium]|nr:3-isopropylmalate dehydratase small subunit [Bacillota bacterium]MCL5039965.1 3-isopropylmalate dehydratase small subunit [Bacillota bacterium]
MILEGKAWRFGDGITTDHIAPGRLYHLRSNLSELAKHVLEDADPGFASKVRPGDFIVAGSNFGQGSSREHAPRIIRMAGVGAVLAQSFARIFFRNAINVGLPVITCRTDKIEEGDLLRVDLAGGKVYDVTKGFELEVGRLPEIMIRILQDGGLVEHIKRHGGLQVLM